MQFQTVPSAFSPIGRPERVAGVVVEAVELQREGDCQVVAQGGAAAEVGNLILD